MTNPVVYLSARLALLAENEPPKLIQLLPVGEARIRDGRKLFSDEADLKRVAAAWLAQEKDVPVLYQHGDDKARGWEAAGWIRKLVLQDDGLYAEVDWLDDAKSEIRAGKWAYISPGIYHRLDENGVMRPTVLQEASLTNIPAIDGMQKIAASEARSDSPSPEQKKEAPMPDPTPKTEPELDLTSLAAKVGELLTPVLATKLAEATGKEVETRLSAIRHEAAVKTAVDEAIGSGRVVAAARPHAEKLAAANVEAFSGLVATLPVQTPTGALSGSPREPKLDPAEPKERKVALSEASAFRSRVSQYAARHGVSEAAAAAFLKAEDAKA